MSERDPLPDRHTLGARVFFLFVRVLVWMIYACFGAPSIWFGSRRVPRKGPLLILSNHQSNCDPPFVQLVTPRHVHFMARRQLWDMPGVGKIVRWWRAFPVSQATADRSALKNAIALLQDGRCVTVFPEGQLSEHGEILPLFSGAALIIRKAKVPCICVGIQNTRRVMPNPDVTPRWAGCWLKARWGKVRQFAGDAGEEEIMGWIRSELLRLTEQAGRE